MDVRQSSKYASGLLKEDQCWRNCVVNIVFLLWIFECCVYTVSSSWKTWSPIYCYLTPKNRFLAAPHLILNQMKLICKYTWLFVMSLKCLQNCAPSHHWHTHERLRAFTIINRRLTCLCLVLCCVVTTER